MLIIVIFQLVYDEIEELSYAKRCQNVFNQQINEFVSTEILERQIEKEFSNKLCLLDPQHDYYEAEKNSLEIKKTKEHRAGLRVLDEKVKAKKKKKNSIKDIEQKQRDEEKYQKQSLL